MKMTTKFIKDINDEYAIVNFIGIEAVMMKENGYINVSKICKDAGKKLDNFINSRTDIMSKYTTPEYGSLIIINHTKEYVRFIKGTYANKQISFMIACWCYPTIRKDMLEVLNKILIEEKNKN